MTRMKQILALVVAVLMLVGVAVITTSAADKVDYNDAAQRLSAINIMKGDSNNNLMLENGVTRYQAALFFVQALTGETRVESWNEVKQSEVFTDVPEYGTAIDYANGIGLIRGRGDGLYGYNDPITYQDMLVLAVRALGYETEGMTYPFGYILAAEKLKLMEGLDETNLTNTKELTRGETAQIIWNMLETEVAFVDPVSDKVVYPNDPTVSDSLRIKLIKKSGFVHGVINATVTKYTPAETSEEIATLTLNVRDGGTLELRADDFEITSRTKLSNFVGLPITIYVDCAADDFGEKYDLVEEHSEAKVVSFSTLDFVTAKNIGDEGNIKLAADANDIDRITLGEETFSRRDYNFFVYTLDEEDGWVREDNLDQLENFRYDSKLGYQGANSYGQISYAAEEYKEGDTVVKNLHMLYMPYEFGLYNTRTLRYEATGVDESLITIGKYDPDAITDVYAYRNFANQKSFFVEYFLSSTVKAEYNEIISISEADGRYAKDAKIEGGSARSGDFIFFYHNKFDNILVVGANCGKLQSGVLSSFNSGAKTVKIDSTTYDMGAAGTFTSNLPTFADFNFSEQFFAIMESGKDNAKFVALDGNIVYLEPVVESTGYVKHKFAIATTDHEIMAELLDMTVAEYENSLVSFSTNTSDDYKAYVDEKGNMAVAMLNTTSGKWELASVSNYEYGTYDNEEDEFVNSVDLNAALDAYMMFGTNYKDRTLLANAVKAVNTNGIFALRKQSGSVYQLSVIINHSSAIDYGTLDGNGITFSDASPKTNLVKATQNSATTKKRLTLTAKSVVVVVGANGEVGVRTGIQGNEFSIKQEGRLYSGTASLIVVKLGTGVAATAYTDRNFLDCAATDPCFGQPHHSGCTSTNCNSSCPHASCTPSLKAWQNASAADTDETYYVALTDSSTSYERVEDGSYEIIITGLFDLKTLRKASGVKVVVDDLDDTELEDGVAAGTILHMNVRGDLAVSDATMEAAVLAAADMRSATDDDYTALDLAGFEFIDSESVTIPEFELSKNLAISKIKVMVATLNASGYNLSEDYNISKVAIKQDYDEAYDTHHYGYEYYASNSKYLGYAISKLDATETISQPTEGAFDDYIVANSGEDVEILIAASGEKYFEGAASVTVTPYAVGQFDEKTGELNLIVIKVIDAYDAD